MLEVTHDRGIATLRLDDGRVNALDTDAMDRIADEVEQLGQEADLGALVIVGNERAFSAGIDLEHVLEADGDGVAATVGALRRVVTAVLDCTAPTVAAIGGHALALGCVLANACDVRVAAADDDARIGLPELAVGVPFPAVAIEVMRWRVGDAALPRLVLLAEGVPLSEALAHGLADEVVAPDELEAHALDVAERLAQVPVATMELTKEQLQHPLRQRLAAAPGSWDTRADTTWDAVEVQDAIRAARRG